MGYDSHLTTGTPLKGEVLSSGRTGHHERSPPQDVTPTFQDRGRKGAVNRLGRLHSEPHAQHGRRRSPLESRQ